MEEKAKEAFDYLYYYYGVCDAPKSVLTNKAKEAWQTLELAVKNFTSANNARQEILLCDFGGRCSHNLNGLCKWEGPCKSRRKTSAVEQKLNGFCEHGNPALDCIHCKPNAAEISGSQPTANNKPNLPCEHVFTPLGGFGVKRCIYCGKGIVG